MMVFNPALQNAAGDRAESQNLSVVEKISRNMIIPKIGQPKAGRTKRMAFASLPLIVLLIVLHSFPGAHAQEYVARDLTIELEDGLVTDAQLTLPKSGTGPFPGVLLLQGTGHRHEEYCTEVTGSDEPSRPFADSRNTLVREALPSCA